VSKVVLVTGGRFFNLTDVVHGVLAPIHQKFGISELHEGCMTGADELCKLWALAHNITVFTHEADWKVFGNRAGPMRNSRMLRASKPDLAVAFPGGEGTADMKMKLAKAKIPTLVGSFVEGTEETQVTWSTQNG